MRVEAIRIYPVKSAGSVDLGRSTVDSCGLRDDRRWMVVDMDGRFLTRRTEPGLARIGISDDGSGWLLDFGDAAPEPLPRRLVGGVPVEVDIWGERVRALEGPRDASERISAHLGRAVRLVWVPDEGLRPVDPAYGSEGDRVSFADGYPLLLVNEASVREASRIAGRPLADRRFRPNVVISGADAFAEDGWASIRIGEVTFEVVKPCARCRVVDLDPATGEYEGGVLKALSTFRRSDGKVLFGENLVPRSEGDVHVGDAVVILERRATASVIMDL